MNVILRRYNRFHHCFDFGGGMVLASPLTT